MPAAAVIAIVIAGIAAAAVFLFMNAGWSEKTAGDATQAYLDFVFKEDSENLAVYMKDMNEEDLTSVTEQWREDMIAAQFQEDVPVTDELKTAYADFYLDLEKKARYTVGEAVKTEEGFEVPVTVEPITCLSTGDFVLMDLQLNDDLSNADLNERIYRRELDLKQELTSTPSYGSPEEFVMHITREKDKTYTFSSDDIRQIYDSYYVIDRHWSDERAEGAVEALLAGIYEKKYAELAQWTVASEDEIRSQFGEVFSKESAIEEMNTTGADLVREFGLTDTYSAPEQIAEKLSKVENSLMEGTKYEVADIETKGDEITATIRLTMYSEDGINEELNARLEKEMDSLSDISSFINRDFEILIQIYNERIENEQYADPVEKQLHFTYNDNKMYEPVLSEIAGLFYIYGSEEGTQEAEQDEF